MLARVQFAMLITAVLEAALAAAGLTVLIGCPGLCSQHDGSVPILLAAIAVALPVVAWMAAGRMMPQADAAPSA